MENATYIAQIIATNCKPVFAVEERSEGGQFLGAIVIDTKYYELWWYSATKEVVAQDGPEMDDYRCIPEFIASAGHPCTFGYKLVKKTHLWGYCWDTVDA